MIDGYKYINCCETGKLDSLLNAETPDGTAEACLSDVLQILQKSPTARCMIKEACAQDFSVIIDDGLSLDTSGFQTVDSTVILPRISARDMGLKKNIGRALITVTAALRRALKADQGYFSRFDLMPMDFLRLNRMAEADIDAVTVQVCWELSTAGENAAWRQWLAGEKGDLAVVFTQGLRNCPMGQFDGKALRYVFRQWFADPERVNNADHTALEMLDMALACPEQFTVTMDTSLTLADLDELQENLPFEGYLKGINIFGKWFDGLRDPFNHLHLHHILTEMKDEFLTPAE